MPTKKLSLLGDNYKAAIRRYHHPANRFGHRTCSQIDPFFLCDSTSKGKNGQLVRGRLEKKTFSLSLQWRMLERLIIPITMGEEEETTKQKTKQLRFLQS